MINNVRDYSTVSYISPSGSFFLCSTDSTEVNAKLISLYESLQRRRYIAFKLAS